MKKYNKYNVNNYFYLNNKKQIKEEEITMGATKFNNIWYTNYNESNIIDIKDNNILSLYVPSTININEVNTDLERTIKKIKQKIKENTEEYKTQGAWKTEENIILYEEITILSIKVNSDNFINKLNEFIDIAKDIKKELTQEGISIGINDGLMII